MIRFLLALLLVFVVGCPSSNAQTVAVFDPQSGPLKGRFVIDPAALDSTAKTLADAGFTVSRVTAEQLANPAQFSAAKFDVYVSRGDAVPRDAIANIKQFSDDGGVLVALAANRPFNIAIAKKANGDWTYAPENPLFSWETGEVSGNVGARYIYKPGLFDSGTKHTATSLLKRYLPVARDFKGREISSWIVPTDGGEFVPLLRAQRADGADVTPQLYIARRGDNYAVISSAAKWTQGAEDWKYGPQTTVALVKIAADLKRGALKLNAADAVKIPADLAPPQPLLGREVVGRGVDPDGAKPLARWGRFDGSGRDLDEPNSKLPRVLPAGQSVELALPAFTGQAWLRVRGAVANSDAGLKISVAGQTLWNELFSYIEAGGAGNTFAVDLSGLPMEFNRIVPIVPGAARALTLSNAGTQPLYFDAVQLESRASSPAWIVGMNAGFNQARFRGPYNLPAQYPRAWTSVRAALWAANVGPPGDPKRFEGLDARMKRYAALGAPLELTLEGTAAWSAISDERYRNSDGRAHTVPADPAKFAEIVEYVIRNYGKNIAKYEIWNEANSPQFFRGTPAEYVAFWREIVPLIKRLDPGKPILTSGMAGWEDDFVRAMIDAGILGEADLFAFHPYSSKAPAWDVPFSDAQGNLYALGQPIEIYNNEMGFTYQPGEWFVGNYNEATQANLTDIAMSRLLADGTAKVSIFHAGGDDHLYSYIAPDGTPRPAYRVLQDYFPLGQNGGKRLDVSVVRADGAPLRGVYVAGATHSDGSITLVVNPSESPQLQTAIDPSESFDKKTNWNPFFGSADYQNGAVTITPGDGKAYGGFKSAPMSVDLDAFPALEIVAPAVAKSWELGVIGEGDKQIIVAKGTEAGTVKVNLAEKLGLSGKQTLTFTLRAFGGPMTLDALKFVGKADAGGAIPIRLMVPLASAQPLRAEVGGQSVPVKISTQGGASFAELEMNLKARSVVTLKREVRN